MSKPEEMWFPIIQAPDYYISNHGRVLSTMKSKPRFLKLGKSDRGYEFFRPSVNGKKLGPLYIHRLVAEYFITNPDNLAQVDHIDRDKSNNIVTNLRWVTVKEQQKNRDVAKGIRSGRAKITEDDVKTIRARNKKGDSYSAIARDYPISPADISKICKRLSWKHVD